MVRGRYRMDAEAAHEPPAGSKSNAYSFFSSDSPSPRFMSRDRFRMEMKLSMKSPLPLPRRRTLAAALLLSALTAVSPAGTTAASAAAAPPALVAGPLTTRPVLRPGDRLAICGDSITEQKMYSRILETYLTVCTPELGLEIRQYGWSGERADGFFERMSNDVLRFRPTVATTCYGMNDHRYRKYEPWIGELYRIHLDAVVRAFRDANVRVVVGSPGSVGKVPSWVRDAGPTVDVLNENLLQIRNLAATVARDRGTAFADVFQPMVAADLQARARYGTNFAVPGKDGVHPDWAGQLIMAYAFLEGLGVSGDLGSISIDLKRGTARGRNGHDVLRSEPGQATIRSTRYPFCADPADPSKDNAVRSGMQWVPFQPRFNRLTLRVTGVESARSYRVTWGDASRSYSGADLRRGINLADDFAVNPFTPAFKQVDEAVAAKQAYETKQIKGEFHGAAGKADMEATALRTEAERAPLVAAIKAAFRPVEHTLRVQAE